MAAFRADEKTGKSPSQVSTGGLDEIIVELHRTTRKPLNRGSRTVKATYELTREKAEAKVNVDYGDHQGFPQSWAIKWRESCRQGEYIHSICLSAEAGEESI